MNGNEAYWGIVSGGLGRVPTDYAAKNIALSHVQETLAGREGCQVTLEKGRQYVVDGITKGWAKKWQANGWMRTKKEAAVNPDLWEKLLVLCGKHDVQFRWVKGHAGNEGNERCDQLANIESAKSNLPADKVYERDD